MKTLALVLLGLAFLSAPAMAADAAITKAEVGKPAPEFMGTDSNGKTHKLSDFKGKTVVLEWTNPECPYVVKHYEPKNMQTLQKEATDAGIIWLSINSSAAGKEGNQTPEQANKYMTDVGSAATARILDPIGEIGKLYDAKTTPHMFIINPEGVLVYAGAIDDNDSFKQDVIATSKNYVREALNELKAGKPITTASTKPYGCSVKYAK